MGVCPAHEQDIGAAQGRKSPARAWIVRQRAIARTKNGVEERGHHFTASVHFYRAR